MIFSAFPPHGKYQQRLGTEQLVGASLIPTGRLEERRCASYRTVSGGAIPTACGAGHDLGSNPSSIIQLLCDLRQVA